MSKNKLQRLRNLAKNKQAETQQIHDEQVAKRAKRKKTKPVEPMLVQPEPVEPPPKKVNSVDVEKWMRQGIYDLYGKRFIIPRWNVKQRTLAKKLLQIYGADLTEKAVKYYCDDWANLVQRSKGKIYGAPTINLLWGMRETIFAQVQNAELMNRQNSTLADEKQSKVNSDEYNAENDKSKGLGW